MATKKTTKKSATKSTKAAKTTKKAPVKKTAPKTSAKTRTQVQSLAVEEPKKVTSAPTTTTTTPKQPMRIKKVYVIGVLVIAILGTLLFLGRGLFVAAVVNGQPISRLAIVEESEKQAGKQALDSQVRNTLIEQEARKQNITVSDQEIDAEIKKVEGTLAKQGQKLDQVLEMQGMSREDLRKLIRLDKLVGKIVGKDVKVTDKDIDAYIEKNKETLPENQDEKQLRASVKDRLQQQMLNEKVQAWLQSVQGKANVMYFVQY
jgi:cell division protein FtsL